MAFDRPASARRLQRKHQRPARLARRTDYPALGRSRGWRSSLPQFSRALFAVAAHLGSPHAIVAHSLGAVAPMHAVARGLPVNRMVLIGPSAPPSLFLEWFAASFRLARSMSVRMRDRIERIEGVDLAEFEPEWSGARITQPTLIVHDEADRVAPYAAGRRIAAALPSSRIEAVQDLGHRRILADPMVARTFTMHLRGA